MTIDKFLAALAKTPREWKLVRNHIRNYRFAALDGCPITAVDKGEQSAGDYVFAARRLKLPHNVAETIAVCSDVSPGCLRTSYKRRLRARLLEACGLSE